MEGGSGEVSARSVLVGVVATFLDLTKLSLRVVRHVGAVEVTACCTEHFLCLAPRDGALIDVAESL